MRWVAFSAPVHQGATRPYCVIDRYRVNALVGDPGAAPTTGLGATLSL